MAQGEATSLSLAEELFDALKRAAEGASAAAAGPVRHELQAAAAELGSSMSAHAEPQEAAANVHLAAMQRCLPQAQKLACLLRQHWQAEASHAETVAAARLDLARAAATRDCANLRCPHFTGKRGRLCSGCRTVRFCCQECNVAAWQAGHMLGHRHVCAALAAARQAAD